MAAVALGLRELARLYDVRGLHDGPVAAVPLGGQLLEEQDEQELAAQLEQLSYEVPAGRWAPVDGGGEPAEPPVRFIDGSVFGRTVSSLLVDGRRRPLLLACLGALALRLDGRRLVRTGNDYQVKVVLCLISNGMAAEHVDAWAHSLQPLGIELLAAETKEVTADFEVLRRRCYDLAKQRMEEAERELLLAGPRVPALVDGLLERRLATIESQQQPVVGLVKRQYRRYLPHSHLGLLYELRPGQRTPAFLLRTEHAHIVSWYLRLSDVGRLSPAYGVVRVSMPREYLEQRFPDPEERWRQISAISAWLCELRHREESYARAGISLEPIVRVEDELHALLPSVDQLVPRFHRALGV